MLELKVHIKQEIQKLLDVGYIKPIQHLTWLANVVVVRRKIVKSVATLTFATLTKRVQKISYIANTDVSVDATTGHSMFSFIDDFGGYNQIKRDPLDVENTIFRAYVGNFHFHYVD